MYVAYTDASVRKKYGGIGYVILKDNVLVDRFRKRTKRMASTELEHLALKELLIHIKKLGIKDIEIRTDYLHVVNKINQCNNINKPKNNAVIELADYINKNKLISIKWTPRGENRIADKLSKQASSGRRKNIHESELIEDYKRKVLETKMVIKHRKYILMRCIACGEKKAATEFPRYKRKKNEKRYCNVCTRNIKEIQNR